MTIMVVAAPGIMPQTGVVPGIMRRRLIPQPMRTPPVIESMTVAITGAQC